MFVLYSRNALYNHAPDSDVQWLFTTLRIKLVKGFVYVSRTRMHIIQTNVLLIFWLVVHVFNDHPVYCLRSTVIRVRINILLF